MKIKLSTGRKLELKPITRDDKDEIADCIEYNHLEDKNGNWQKVDIKAPQKLITSFMRKFIVGGDFKKFTTTASGVISDSCLDEFSVLERNDFFSEVLKLVFEGNEEPSDSNSIS